MTTPLWMLLAVAVVAGAGVAVMASSADCQPRHVHIAYGHNTTEVVVTWSTLTDTDASTVEWGTDMFNLTMNSKGGSRVFVDGGALQSTQFIHRVHLHKLLPDTGYYYHVGCDQAWSAVFGFKTFPARKDGATLKLAVFGDLGTVNGQSLARLQQESHQGMYDAVLHVGDMAYNMFTDNGKNGDLFMDQIEPIAAYLPYMTCPGNHENSYDFLQYRSRFSMPDYNKTESIYFSFDIGLVHFISVSTEVYFWENIEKRAEEKYIWLVADLEAATTPKARAEHPWIILFGHRPMYCWTVNGGLCNGATAYSRVGLPGSNKFGMEPLLAKYGVDLSIWAHEHNYERLYPLYNFTIMKGSEDEPYTNPGAPVHITTGSAGCDEGLNNFLPDPPAWSAVRVTDYGYTRIHVHNKTHLYWEQVSDAKAGALTDSVWLIRDKHERYNVD